VVARVHELLPQRKPAYRRVTPLASRRETQRRAAMALVALLVVVGSLAMSVWAFGGQRQQGAISSVNAGQDALAKARANLKQVDGPGIDLITDDREEAIRLLTEAYDQLDVAEDSRISSRVVEPVREDVVALLDRAYGVVEVASRPLFTFKPAKDADPIDLRALVQGYDRAPYVIDRSTRSVYRVDLKRKRATVIARIGRNVGSVKQATPQFLAVGGRDLLILDAKNQLWRWRASNDAGRGTTNRVTVNGASQWGDDILAIGTYMRNPSQNLYNLYVVDPSEQQIRAYPPASDGGGFPAKSSAWLATARDVANMSSLYIDGDIYITENGVLDRYTSGKSDGWEPGAPGDDLLRPTSATQVVAGAGGRNEGRIYTYDKRNARIMAFDKRTGDFVQQYRLAEGDGWKDIRAMYVVPGVEDAPDVLVWLSANAVNQATLEAAPEPEPSASGSPGASASPSTSPSS
jgi:hypothetical protein